MEMKMREGYMTDGRKMTGVMDHSHSFCCMEELWLKYLAVSKSRDPLRSRVGVRRGHWIRYSFFIKI